MSIKTLKIKELTGATLNWAVAKALGKLESYEIDHRIGEGRFHLYSTDLQLGGDIIERNHISTMFIHEGLWLANNSFDGRTHIEAGVRFFVWDHLGDEIDVPLAQYEYESEISDLANNLSNFSSEEIYGMRVRQLENEDMTTSDAQGVADVEESRGKILDNVKLNLDRQPFSYPQ